VVVVSQSFVRRYFPASEPLGHRVRRTGGPHPWATIVGLVPDVMDAGVGVDVGPAIYIPFAQNSSWWIIFVVKSSLPLPQLDRVIRAALATLALAPACTAIYGATAFLMTERTKEIAIRMALGAAPRSMLVRPVLDNERWIAGGAFVGLAAAWVAGVIWRAKVPELSTAGALAYVATPVVLLGVSVVAMWAPAYRASRTPPAVALRAD